MDQRQAFWGLANGRMLLLSLAILAAAAFAGLMLSRTIVLILRRLAVRRNSLWLELLGRYLERPLRLLLPVVLAGLSLPFLPLLDATKQILLYGLALLFIAASAWLAVGAVLVLRDLILSH